MDVLTELQEISKLLGMVAVEGQKSVKALAAAMVRLETLQKKIVEGRKEG